MTSAPSPSPDTPSHNESHRPINADVDSYEGIDLREVFEEFFGSPRSIMQEQGDFLKWRKMQQLAEQKAELGLPLEEAEVLSNLKHKTAFFACPEHGRGEMNFKRILDGRKMVFKADVYDGADDLCDGSF